MNYLIIGSFIVVIALVIYLFILMEHEYKALERENDYIKGRISCALGESHGKGTDDYSKGYAFQYALEEQQSAKAMDELS